LRSVSSLVGIPFVGLVIEDDESSAVFNKLQELVVALNEFRGELRSRGCR
jgi:hypothetical protein